ncbi:MAG: O-antigen translocase [Chloroflexi bacterium]|nr:MAG: O-antigen translocase [Chloroflexota bacterium]
MQNRTTNQIVKNIPEKSKMSSDGKEGIDKSLTNRIMKSTAIIGGSSAVNVIFQIIRAKVVALLLGPAGLGLISIFSTVVQLASMLSGMGIDTSGVRQIAIAAEQDDRQGLVKIISSYRRTAFALGILGAVLLFALRGWVSQMTFGDQSYADSVGWLSFAVFFTVVANSQSTIIRGMRQIGDLARAMVLGAAVGTILGLPIIYYWRERGIALYLVFVAAMMLIVAWWYARKFSPRTTSQSWRTSFQEARTLITLGFAFMTTGLITLGTTYLIKSLVIRVLGLDAAGLFEAASRLSNVYVGFILGAMGADFFPHLAGVVHDSEQSNALINEQVRIGSLLAVPGLLGVLFAGDWLFQLLYSSEFVAGAVLLRWLVLGTFLRVISWPLGYLVLAQGKGKLFFVTELAANIVYISFAYWGAKSIELIGVGVAFFILYLFYSVLMTIVAFRISGFRWTRENLLSFIWMASAVAVGFGITFIEPMWLSASLGGVLTAVVAFYSTWVMYCILGKPTIQNMWHQLRTHLKMT